MTIARVEEYGDDRRQLSFLEADPSERERERERDDRNRSAGTHPFLVGDRVPWSW